MARSSRLIVVADTGGIYALLDDDDLAHHAIRAWWESGAEDVVLPVTILPEITYLVHERRGVDAEIRFAEAVAAGEFAIEPVERDDIGRAAVLMADYRDLRLGFVDATVIAVAERLDARSVLTTDRRHFGVVRPRHVERLRLVP